MTAAEVWALLLQTESYANDPHGAVYQARTIAQQLADEAPPDAMSWSDVAGMIEAAVRKHLPAEPHRAAGLIVHEVKTMWPDYVVTVDKPRDV